MREGDWWTLIGIISFLVGVSMASYGIWCDDGRWIAQAAIFGIVALVPMLVGTA